MKMSDIRMLEDSELDAVSGGLDSASMGGTMGQVLNHAVNGAPIPPPPTLKAVSAGDILTVLGILSL
jgi:hypothetical protein